MHHRVNSRNRNSMLLSKPSQRLSLRAFVSNFLHSCCRKFGTATPFSLSGASALNHVFRIIRTGSSDKMVWPYTWAIVAGMTHQLTSWYRAVGKLVSNTVSVYVLLIYRKCCIAIIETSGSPQPAVICFSHLCPESLSHIVQLVLHAALPRTESLRMSYRTGALFAFVRLRLPQRSHILPVALARTVRAVTLSVLGFLSNVSGPHREGLIAPFADAGYFSGSHDVNLRDRFTKRLGPHGRRNLSAGPSLFYHET